MTKKVQINLYVNKELRDKLRKLAATKTLSNLNNPVSPGTVAIEILTEFFDRQSSNGEGE